MNYKDLYQKRFSAKEGEKRSMLWKVITDRFLSHFILPTDTVLDIGAGSLEFLESIEAKTKIAVDIQYTKVSAQKGILQYPSIHTCIRKHKQSVDVVMLSNILEHLKDREDILSMLTSIKKFLKPRGSLLIIQPVIDLTHEAYWDFFDHICPITRKSLVEALTLAGYRIELFVPRFLPYTTKTSFPIHPICIRLYLLLPWYLRPFAGQCFVKAVPNRLKRI